MPTTTAQALRETQAPIKDSYRNNPASAVVTLKSIGSLDASSITCKLSTNDAVKQASKVAGLHPKAGGPDPDISGELCSGDMLLDALVACSGVTLKAVATALSIPIISGVVTAQGDLDFRGTLGVDRSAPMGITNIRLSYDIDFGDREDGSVVSENEVESLGRLTERYCVVLQTLMNKPEISVKVKGRGGGKEEKGVSRELSWSHTV